MTELEQSVEDTLISVESIVLDITNAERWDIDKPLVTDDKRERIRQAIKEGVQEACQRIIAGIEAWAE